MNGGTEPLEPLFEILPGSRLFFVLYMVLCSWAILSILTAVISDNMISVAEADKEEQREDEAQRQWTDSMNRMREILSSADADGSGLIEKEEFRRLLVDAYTADELCDAAGLSKEELNYLYECLSCMHHGRPVPVEGFLEGLSNDNQPVRQRDTLQIEKRMALMEASLSRVEAALVGPKAGAPFETSNSRRPPRRKTPDS